MNVRVSCIAKCIGIGLIVGAVLSIVGCTTIKSDRSMKKKAKKAFKNMEDFMDDIQYIFK